MVICFNRNDRFHWSTAAWITRATCLVLAVFFPAIARAQLVVHYDFNDSDNLFQNVVAPGTHDGSDLDDTLGDRFDLPLESWSGGAVDFYQEQSQVNREAIVIPGLDPTFFDGSTDWAFEVDFRTTGVKSTGIIDDVPTVTHTAGVLLSSGIDPQDAFVPAFGSNHRGIWKPASGLGPDDGPGLYQPLSPRSEELRMTDNLNVMISPQQDITCDHSPVFDSCEPGQNLTHITGGARVYYGGWHNPFEANSETYGRWWNASVINGEPSLGGANVPRRAIDAGGSLRAVSAPRSEFDHPIDLIDGEWHNLKVVYSAPLATVNNEAATAEEASNQPLGTFYMRIDNLWVTKQAGLGTQQVERDATGEPVPHYTVLGNSIDVDGISAFFPRGGAFQGEMDNVKIFATGETPGDLRIEVDTTTGEMKLYGGSFARQLRSISIESASGSLLSDEWISFSDQQLPTEGGGEGDNWQELVATRYRLSEELAEGASRFSNATNANVSIGNIFAMTEARSADFGDYSGNQVVDMADANVWRDHFGALVAPGSLADGNGNGRIDAGDYNIWRDNFGSELNRKRVEDLVVTLGVEVPTLLAPADGFGVGPSELRMMTWNVDYFGSIPLQGANVPEPHALVVLMVSLCMLLSARRWVRAR